MSSVLVAIAMSQTNKARNVTAPHALWLIVQQQFDDKRVPWFHVWNVAHSDKVGMMDVNYRDLEEVLTNFYHVADPDGWDSM